MDLKDNILRDPKDTKTLLPLFPIKKKKGKLTGTDKLIDVVFVGEIK